MLVIVTLCHFQLISFEYTTPCISQKVFGSFLKWEIDFESEVAFGRFVMKGKDNIEGQAVNKNAITQIEENRVLWLYFREGSHRPHECMQFLYNLSPKLTVKFFFSGRDWRQLDIKLSPFQASRAQVRYVSNTRYNDSSTDPIITVNKHHNMCVTYNDNYNFEAKKKKERKREG